MFTLSSDGTSPYHVDVLLNGVPVQMELDTGASLTIINETIPTIKCNSSPQFLSSSLHSMFSRATQVTPYSCLDTVRYGSTQVNLPVHVVGGGGPNLMGRDWLSHFDVDLNH